MYTCTSAGMSWFNVKILHMYMYTYITFCSTGCVFNGKPLVTLILLFTWVDLTFFFNYFRLEGVGGGGGGEGNFLCLHT